MENDDDGIKTVSCRIPETLHTQISDLAEAHPDRPSYGQIAWWSCQDYQGLVIARVVERLHEKRLTRTQRQGRGRAGRRTAVPTVPMTPRLWPEELAAIDATHQVALERVAADPELHTMKVSRTAIVVAAFEVALETSLPNEEEDP